MQISTALLLNAQTTATTVDKKVSKEALKQAFLSSTEAPSAMPQPSSNMKEIVANLLGSLLSEAKSKSAILDLLQNTPIFKNLGNFSNDLKSLIAFLKSDLSLEKPLLFCKILRKVYKPLMRKF